VRRWLLFLLFPACLAGGGGGDVPRRDRLWGFTVDDPWRTEAVAEALAAMPRRPMARVVFDLDQPPGAYRGPLAAIGRVADVMGELLDSRFVAQVTTDAYAARAEAFVRTLGPRVDVWEVGNEVNGEWLGKPGEVAAKVEGAYRVVKAHGGRAAVTLYYNEGCRGHPGADPVRWAGERLSAEVRAGLDYVFVSRYEDDCPGPEPDWPAVFARLARLFPRAGLGIGECGTKAPDRKEALVRRYYGMRLSEPRFVGGYFWWDFGSDMVPSSRPLHGLVRDLMRAAPGG
jgi:hypothetical protein